MADTKNPGDKTLSVAPSKTLTLKRGVEQGVVRQSFSHGRTKQVVVEKVVKRGPVIAKKPEAAPAPVAKAPPPVAKAPEPVAKPVTPRGVVLRKLTDEEQNARATALAGSREREAEDRLSLIHI